MNNQVVASPASTLNQFLMRHKNQIEMALPKHITAERMTRLALTAFSQNRELQKCSPQSIFGSVVVAAQLGLEIGVAGQGYLVPYKGSCTFVPGWQGLVDLVSRSGRATVWTGAVYRGDKFDWALGDRPFVKHQPEGDGDDWHDITHVYAIGRVNGSDHPVIEVWTMDRIVRHLNKYNKVGGKHYALTNNGQNMEMYARKVALLQVLKYMPKSIEVMRAMDVANAVDSGQNFTFDGDVVVVQESDDTGHGDQGQAAGQKSGRPELPECTDEDFKAKTARWRRQLLDEGVPYTELLSGIESVMTLTEDQKTIIHSWTQE
ncbi:recombinase RecT [Herbaspirillum sp.]|uniref:recombinase RecT n=1 Tax=Herbaspirillum sp. TaxID=1890675 RepID=UPI000C09E36F|nr:recombinase RecT [Herbaspirillum sp.]MAF04380.1 recombinase RecT [Herbaspirillum sp.]|tara:strand:- start:1166 stop:2119 length:954 start_codon:yes stop_codon:yes gene_type:complete